MARRLFTNLALAALAVLLMLAALEVAFRLAEPGATLYTGRGGCSPCVPAYSGPAADGPTLKR